METAKKHNGLEYLFCSVYFLVLYSHRFSSHILRSFRELWSTIKSNIQRKQKINRFMLHKFVFIKLEFFSLASHSVVALGKVYMEIYVMPYTRASSYLIGMILGWLLHHIQVKNREDRNIIETSIFGIPIIKRVILWFLLLFFSF